MTTILDPAQSNIDQWPDFDHYRPLDPSTNEIRLLRVQPFDDKADVGKLIKCSFFHYSLDNVDNESVLYSALSYYWGAPGEYAKIWVDDYAVEIRRTLYAFLKNLILRHRNTKFIIWLDVLCINQRNVDERNHQVALMTSIFSSAKKVYAWLGEGDADCRYAMS